MALPSPSREPEGLTESVARRDDCAGHLLRVGQRDHDVDWELLAVGHSATCRRATPVLGWGLCGAGPPEGPRRPETGSGRPPATVTDDVEGPKPHATPRGERGRGERK